MQKFAELNVRPRTSIDDSSSEQMTGAINTSDATIVLATHSVDRWPFLAALIDSISAEDLQPASVVICVDNNEELYRRARSTWPHITVVANTGSRGASAARNFGADLAETPFIVFIDDDVHLCEGWLPALLKPLSDPRVIGTGGGVIANWQNNRPGWFPEEFDWVVGASYKGMPVTQSIVRNVWSENMAVRTEAFRTVGGFRSGFGKVGDLSRPEDTDLCIRMATAREDSHWVYVPDARVKHHVPKARSTLSFFIRRTYHEGRGKVEMAALLGRQEKLQQERDYLRRTLPQGFIRSFYNSTTCRDAAELGKAATIIIGATAAAIGAFAGTSTHRTTLLRSAAKRLSRLLINNGLR